MTLKFKDVFTGTQAVLGADPAQAQAVFHAQSRLGDGLNSTVAIRQFSVGVDEPPGLGGQDAAPNPVEYILAALGVLPGNHLSALCRRAGHSLERRFGSAHWRNRSAGLFQCQARRTTGLSDHRSRGDTG
jgi:hypothetical protein